MMANKPDRFQQPCAPLLLTDSANLALAEVEADRAHGKIVWTVG